MLISAFGSLWFTKHFQNIPCIDGGYKGKQMSALEKLL